MERFTIRINIGRLWGGGSLAPQNEQFMYFQDHDVNSYLFFF